MSARVEKSEFEFHKTAYLLQKVASRILLSEFIGVPTDTVAQWGKDCIYFHDIVGSEVGRMQERRHKDGKETSQEFAWLAPCNPVALDNPIENRKLNKVVLAVPSEIAPERSVDALVSALRAMTFLKYIISARRAQSLRSSLTDAFPFLQRGGNNLYISGYSWLDDLFANGEDQAGTVFFRRLMKLSASAKSRTPIMRTSVDNVSYIEFQID